MFWKKKTTRAKPKPAAAQSPVKPNKPRETRDDGKRIELVMNCYVYVVDTEELVQCKTVNVAKSAMLLKSIHPLAAGQDVVCLLSEKKRLSKIAVQADKNALKGRIARVEKEPYLFLIDVEITFGRIDPTSIFDINTEFTKFWWSRHWS
ncbi:MAG: hypothetical protein GC154_03880 [bacterium]|nr:hypothetical protein [bacterium]